MEQATVDFISIATNGAINKLSSPVDEIEVINKGISVGNLKQLQIKLKFDMPTSARILHTTKRTLERYVQGKKPLNPVISENILALARLATFGTEYFGSVERWKDWLNTPNVQFKNQTPASVIHTQQGREYIKRVIGGLKYGFTA